MKVRFKLRIVPRESRPLANLSRAEKLAKAIAFLRERNRYILDQRTQRPAWGVPGDWPKVRTTIGSKP